MLLEITCQNAEAADRVREAVEAVLNNGYRTGDIMSDGGKLVSCSQMGDLVVEAVRSG
jgi:3-isopropylmalate dehydrogenase